MYTRMNDDIRTNEFLPPPAGSCDGKVEIIKTLKQTTYAIKQT